MALVRFIYPRDLLGRGIGINAMVVAVSAAVGPTIAAGILAVGTWPYLFAVNIPIGIAALVLGWRYLPHTRRAPHLFDWQSAGLSAITFGFLIAAIDSLGHGETLSDLPVGACRRGHRLCSAGLSADAFRVAVAAGRSVADFGIRAVDRDLDRLLLRPDAGLCRDPVLPRKPLRIFGGRDRPSDHAMADRGRVRCPARRTPGRTLSRRALGGIGLLLFAAGLGALAMVPATPSSFDVIWRMALAGAGFGLFQTPNNRTMIAAAPRERSGGASGMLGTARLLGQTTGAALVALFLARDPQGGTRISLLAGASFAVLGAALSMLRLSEAGARGAERVQVHEGQRLKGE